MRDKTSLSIRNNVKSYQTIGDGHEHRAKQVFAPNHPVKHIHPCICDLTEEQKKRIIEHQRKLLKAQLQYEERIKELHKELEEQNLSLSAREREAAEEKEFYGDEYTMVGRKRKRKKRSARRASMISLGVRTVINSTKPPLIEVKHNETSKLRKLNVTYCKPKKPPLSAVRLISYGKSPIIPVRSTKSFELRAEESIKKYEKLKLLEDDRPRFITPVLYL